MSACVERQLLVTDAYSECVIGALLIVILTAVVFLIFLLSVIVTGNWMAGVLLRPPDDPIRNMLIAFILWARNALGLQIHEDLPVSTLLTTIVVVTFMSIAFTLTFNFTRCTQMM